MSLETFERLPAEKRELIISVGIDEFSRKAYKDVCTDDITKKCGISKGILFHYFGSKKAYYFYCLSRALDCLTAETDEAGGEDFYEILFAAMNRKISVCRQHMAEMRLVNMASRDPSGDIAEQKAKLIHRYMSGIQAESERTLKKALAVLKLSDTDMAQLAAEGLQLYINAVLNRYLLEYQKTPDEFFQNSEKIRDEMKAYLNLMLYGIWREEKI